MKVIENQPLDQCTTVQIGGIAKKFLIPETADELLTIIQEEKPKYFIGGGSNLLIAERTFDLVVGLGSFDTRLEYLGNGEFRAGASLRLQKLINGINEREYGGPEYLYSVPGLLGGAVVMNAGRGKKHRHSLADYIVSVDVIRDGKQMTLSKEECHFAYRKSVFRNNGDIVTSALMKFPEMLEEESSERKKNRMEFQRVNKDASKPNFGTVFCESNYRIMRFAKKYELGGKVHFSGKTLNWIVNEGGSFDAAIHTIEKVEQLHKLLLQPCRREVVVWE